MAPEALLEKLKIPPETRSLPNMFDLPSEHPEDLGLPDAFHYDQASLLMETFRMETPHFMGTDLHVYYDSDHTDRYKSPDWFVALGVDPLFQGEIRRSYVVWAEGARPYIAIEFLSPSTRNEDLGRSKRKPDEPPTKWEVYEQILAIPYYIVYDRETAKTRAFRNHGGLYRELTVASGIPFPEIGLELKRWHGCYRQTTTDWLRWFDADGMMIPTPSEQARKECTAKEKALSENERLRALLADAGIDPDQ